MLERQVLGGEERLLSSGSLQPGKRVDPCPKTISEVPDQAEEFKGENGEGEFQETE